MILLHTEIARRTFSRESVWATWEPWNNNMAAISLYLIHLFSFVLAFLSLCHLFLLFLLRFSPNPRLFFFPPTGFHSKQRFSKLTVLFCADFIKQTETSSSWRHILKTVQSLFHRNLWDEQRQNPKWTAVASYWNFSHMQQIQYNLYRL